MQMIRASQIFPLNSSLGSEDHAFLEQSELGYWTFWVVNASRLMWSAAAIFVHSKTGDDSQTWPEVIAPTSSFWNEAHRKISGSHSNSVAEMHLESKSCNARSVCVSVHHSSLLSPLICFPHNTDLREAAEGSAHLGPTGGSLWSLSIRWAFY